MTSTRETNMELGWRIVTTGHDAGGKEVIRSDRSLTVKEKESSVRVGQVLSLNGPATGVTDGEIVDGVRAHGVGSLTVDALVLDPSLAWLVDPAAPPSGSFEAYIVVHGGLCVVVGDDEAQLAAGEVFLPRGQAYGVRTAGADEVRAVRVSAVPDPAAPVAEHTAVRAASGPPTWVRRVLAGPNDAGRPCLVQDGDPAVLLVVGDILLQRGTNHLWQAVGEHPLQMMTVMLGVRS